MVSAVCLSMSIPGCQRLPTDPSGLDFQVLYRTVIGQLARHSAFPSVAVVNDSDLVVVFREGSGHVSSDGRIAMSRSTDGGRSFSEPATIVDTPLDDRDPALTRLRDGRLAVNFFALDAASDDVAHGSRDRRHLYVVFSDDDGQSWSPLVEAQQPLRDQRLASRSQLLDVGGQTLLWPAYYAEAGSSLLYRSLDGGQTWRFFSLMADSTVAAFVEPSLVQLSSGRLLASFRTRAAQGWRYHLSQPIPGRRTHLVQTSRTAYLGVSATHVAAPTERSPHDLWIPAPTFWRAVRGELRSREGMDLR